MSLDMFVIYDHPKDHPDCYVVRRWAYAPRFVATNEAKLATTLERAREHVPRGHCRVPRSPGDDPVIVESWLPAWLVAQMERAGR